MTPPPATCVITTKNRKAELKAAIASALSQSVPIEVLVIDDGSTDGTPDLVREEFPGVRLHRAEQSQGYIVQRNLGASLALAPIVFSIDDDAIFSTPFTVEQTLAEFDHRRVGAVAIPFINVKQDDKVRQRAPSDGRIWVTASYIGTAHAVRRELFLSLGGYRAHLVHQGEEGDYCIRMLASGHVARLGRADPIHHFESPRRDKRRMDLYGRRNDVLYAWHNVPLAALPAHLAGTTINGLRYGVKSGRFWQHARGVLNGYGASLRFFGRRNPVNSATYRLSRSLKTRGDMPMSEIEPLLPPVTGHAAAGP
jgi:glycosyltransferase involved in cell wall biosynthesis